MIILKQNSNLGCWILVLFFTIISIGLRIYNEQNIEKFEAYQEEIRKDPKKAKDVFKKQEIFYQVEIGKEPYNLENYKNLATALIDQGEINQAIKVYEKAITFDKNKTDDYIRRQLAALVWQKEPERSYSLLKEALEINPNSAITYNNLATLFLGKRENKQAIDFFQKALFINPNSIKTKSYLEKAQKDLQSQKTVR